MLNLGTPVLELDFWLLEISMEEQLLKWYDYYLKRIVRKLLNLIRISILMMRYRFYFEMRNKIYGVDEGDAFIYF